LAGEIIVLITAPSMGEARRIGRTLVEEKLAACVNVVPQIFSVFRWKNSICRERESLLVLKTRRSCFKPLAKRVKSLHSYSVPEVIAIPIVLGSEDYLRWIRQSTR
jgi:periplasmic divalent cation tolerance protein